MRRHLFLYLAIACFLVLLAIFVVDGYMGIYDTIHITAGEHKQMVEPDHWYRHRYDPSAGTVWGSKVFFTYTVENRRFSSYVTPVKASVWQEKEKVFDLFSQEESVEPFGKVIVAWTLDSNELESRGFSYGQYTVKIEREGAERNILVSFHTPAPTPPKPPPRPA